MGREAGAAVILLGGAIVVIGILIAAGALGWFGRLPGDVRLGGGSVRVYVPIVSMLIVSVALTVIVNVLRRFL